MYKFNKYKLVTALEKSLGNAETTERKMRLNYLLAKLHLDMGDKRTALWPFLEAQDFLEVIGQEGLMGFRDFYRYRDKLNELEFVFFESMGL